MSFVNDVDLAASLADVAGRVLLDLRRCNLLTGKALGEAGDQTANAFLVRAIRHQRPDDGLLSEESADDKSAVRQAPGVDHRSAWTVRANIPKAATTGRCMSH